jgi:HK97 family phage major capsid protein
VTQIVAEDLFDKLVRGVRDRLDTSVARTSSDGQKFPLGNGSGTVYKAAGAPAYNRGPRGDDPYCIRNLLASLVHNDPTLAPMEVDISHKLVRSGYTCSPRSYLIPIHADMLIRTPGHESTIDEISTITKQVFPRGPVDTEGVRALERKYAVKTLDAYDDTRGGTLIAFPDQGQLLDLMRAREIFSRSGARSVPLPPQGAMYMPSSTSDATYEFGPPNVAINDSDTGTGSVTLIAKTARALVKLPNDIIRFSGGAAEDLVRLSLTLGAARVVDHALLEGSGGTLVPQGLINYRRSAAETPTQGQVTLHVAALTGMDGDTFSPTDVTDMLSLLEEGNVETPTAWIMRPRKFWNIASARADAVSAGDSAGAYLFPVTRGALGNAIVKEMLGTAVLTSTTVSNTRAKGSAANLTFVVVGDFSRFLIGRVGALEIALSDQAAFAADQLWIRATLRFDGAPTHPQAFCISDTLLV